MHQVKLAKVGVKERTKNSLSIKTWQSEAS